MEIKNLEIFDQNRIRILYTLYNCKKDICGCDLVERLDIPKNLLSYHMKILRENGFVVEQKCGKRKIYKINQEKAGLVEKALDIVELI
jgi:ArsR family transcriptional regulator